jgi:hypothetical protein
MRKDHAVGPALGVSVQQRHEAATVLRQCLGHGDIAQLEDRRKQVDMGGDLQDFGVGPNVIEPAGE